MKTIKLFILSMGIILSFSAYAQVAINTDGTSPNASAMLDVKSTDAGILIPRLTATQRDAISSPATGLLVYVTDNNIFYFYSGSSWEPIISGNDGDEDWIISGNDMYSYPSGNVGIGTTTPNEKLEVNGSIRMTDGNEALGRVLASDVNGTASWVNFFDELMPTESYQASTSEIFFDAGVLCTGSTYNGYEDWRLPDMYEAEYLDHLGQFGNISAYHWVRSPDGFNQAGTSRKYGVYNPRLDRRQSKNITSSYYVRCVR